MNFAFVGILLLDVAYLHSPLAQCMDMLNEKYLVGNWIPPANESSHEVDQSKDGVYMISDKVFLVRKFQYDGKGPKAQFIIGKTDDPDMDGKTCLYDAETNVDYKLDAWDATKDVRVMLSADLPFAEAKYFSVYCRVAKRPFAWVKLPPTEALPAQMDLGEFTEASADHGVKGTVKVLSSQAFEISGFALQLKGAAKIYFMAGKTDKPDETGGDMLPNEEYKDPPEPLSKDYAGVTVIIKLSQDKSYCMYKWFGLFDAEGKKSLGHVMLKEGKIPPEVGQTPGPGWGPTTTTVGPGGATPDSSSEESSEEESEDTPAPDTPPPETDQPTETERREATTTAAPMTTTDALLTVPSLGIVITAATFVLYFYH